ncbi:hypothetical protein [Saccharothrix texasensis]|uniref:DUF3291 domain-containing protein n=1 Tax=Saccharothrix texasensis TaxID=103734 RepID=A0A3N1H5V1_9PSEU|nr:hypothetical protein [Saccharothrix texasensis]ROP37897.1 hypothetical protein EDD40_3227 [Saccharothrix texasensis]
MLRNKWITGPESGFAGPGLVSVTEFTLDDLRRTPGAYRAGFTLSRAWPGLNGAVGLWLWAEPLRKRLGSVSVWRDHAGMRGFVGLPAHVAIMRKYRELGVTRATTWHTEDVDPHGTWRTAARWLRDRA